MTTTRQVNGVRRRNQMFWEEKAKRRSPGHSLCGLVVPGKGCILIPTYSIKNHHLANNYDITIYLAGRPEKLHASYLPRSASV